MKKKMKILSLALLLIVSLIVILYPLIANYLSEKNRSLIETQYTEAIEQMDTTALDEARAAASAYNETLLTVPDKPFTKDALIKASESYDALLNVREDGIMGYVEIPAIGVNLPIYHGTEESTLDRGVLFFLRVMGETLAYRVTDIYTVLPEDTGKLTIDAGRDLCTLVTCTPYGVNSHRLLIRGERTEYEEAVSVIEDAEFTPVEESTWGDEYRHGLIYGCLTVAEIGACYGGYRAVLHARRPKRRRYAMRRERMRGKHEAP